MENQDDWIQSPNTLIWLHDYQKSKDMASSSWNTPKDVIFPKMMKIVIPGAPLREISYIKNILKSTKDDQIDRSAWFDFNMDF